MKKFVFGLVCGIVLSCTLTVFASGVITAYDFPSKVFIHIGNTVKEMDLSGDKIINYNSRTYIPLRTFSKSMSSYVTYQQATGGTGKFNKIDVFVVKEKDFFYRDVEGYLSMNVTKIESVPVENYPNDKIVHGMIRINKDMTGKRIEINVLDKDGKIISTSYPQFVLDGELFGSLKEGDIRNFSERMEIKGEPFSYQVKVVDCIQGPNEFGAVMGRDGDVMLVFGGPPNEKISISENKILNIGAILVYNQSEKKITLKPIDLGYQILKIIDGKDEVICNYPVSKSSMEMPGRTFFQVYIPSWDFKDKNGNLVSAGKYAIQLKLPENFEYFVEGSTSLKKLPAEENMYNKRYEFNIAK